MAAILSRSQCVNPYGAEACQEKPVDDMTPNMD